MTAESRRRQEMPFDQRVALARTGCLPEQIAWRQQREADQAAKARAEAQERERQAREFKQAVTGRKVRD